MIADEKRLRSELPEFLELLEDVAGWIGALELSRAGQVPDETIRGLREALLRADSFLLELFALRRESPPSPDPGIPFASLGPSLRKTLPQRLAAQLADELNTVTGRRLEDVSQFTALGLYARISDLVRFVDFLEGQRAEAAKLFAPPTVVSERTGGARRRAPKSAPSAASEKPAPPPPEAVPAPPAPKAVAASPAPARRETAGAAAAPPAPPARTRPSTASVRRSAPVPTGPGPDLSAYDIRIDEAGERVDTSAGRIWFAATPGPGVAGEGRAAAFAVSLPGGVAFAVAEGGESSLGARLAAVVAVRAFCRAAALSPSAPASAVQTAQGHLDMLLSALLGAGDASAALAKVRGEATPANARRILAHTRRPEEALRRVPPALAAGLVGGVATETSGGTRVSLVRLGAASAELRTAGRVVSLLGAPRGAGVPFLAPGARGLEELGRLETAPPVTLAPGDALLLATPAVAKSSPGAWSALASLGAAFPDGLSAGESARELLRKAERWGLAEPPHFAGPLAIALLLSR